ncbi:MAG: DUF389 domain-containing protein [Thermoanaerobaculia bacterium]|nr:DUF389 domain-containing protein [Thermoanaerobaculia bacterium]
MSTLAVVVHRQDGADLLASWSQRFARSLEADLLVVWVVRPRDAGEDDDRMPEEAASLLQRLSEPMPPSVAELPLAAPEVRLVWPDADDPVAGALEAIADHDVDWLVVAPPRKKGLGSQARRLFRTAPCHTVLFHAGATDGSSCRRLLVPTAGGPSARQALVLADRLARAEGAVVEPLFVEPSAMGREDEGEQVGHHILDQALISAGVSDRDYVQPRVVRSDHLPTAIEGCIREEHDLVLLGASHAGVVRKLLFGTVPERLLDRPDGLAVGVVREQWTLGDRLRAQVGRWLDLRIPQLSRDHRVDLYQRIQSGSEWSFDFLFLIALSTLIAGLGLLQSSAAVVIGAMLVAPLMTPILGIGLALLQGNWPLLRGATRAVVSGYLLALLLGVVLGRLTAPSELTSELWARGGPTLLDMGVGFFAGLAAAYCLGRPGLTAALPGVAIAAALVPPIATTGIALARSEWDLAKGSSLLFGTNVVAIVLGCAASLYAVGVRAREQPTKSQRRTRLLVVALMAILCVLAVPLTESWIDTLEVRQSQGLDRGLLWALQQDVESRGLGWVDAQWRGADGDRNLRVTIESERPLEPSVAAELLDALRSRLPESQRAVEVRLVTQLVTSSNIDS